MGEVRIVFEKDQHRAAAYDGDKCVGTCVAAVQKAFWIIRHTATDIAYNGQGIAGKLVDCVMDASKTAGVKVKPFCPFAAYMFEKNPEYKAMEDTSIITVYSMKTCPDCTYVEEQAEGNPAFKFIDIGEHVKNLKAFLRLRDADSVFDEVKKNGSIGIPCFVMEDGGVTLVPEEAGLRSRPQEEAAAAAGAACSLDGSGC